MTLNVISFLLGSTKGYNQAFLSGDNEPWVFRGGLTGELQVCMAPNHGIPDLFIL